MRDRRGRWRGSCLRRQRPQRRFTSSERFKKMVSETFRAMDMDNSGVLENLDVYYTKIIAISPTSVPPTKSVVDEMVLKVGANKNGKINPDEFLDLATLLAENTAGRVTVDLIFKYAIAPLIASIFVMVLDIVYPNMFGKGVIAEGIEAMRTAVFVSLVLMFLAPIVVSQIDVFFVERKKDA